ncbi:mitochondrial inner membrane protease subunit 2 [Coccomyxa sp. Obi]|nr:mitochondrial inner membrane protease subunit 2 [Coccomyxa sp. Obi]
MIKTVWRIAKLVPVVVAVEDCLYGPASVHGRSMQPTFNPEPATGHDLVLADKWSIKLYRYNRGDIVLLRSPEDPNMMLIKRLLALEGDWVTIPGSLELAKIPKGHCWVEGDNPEFSADSRSRFGPVPIALIEGRVRYIFWPPSRVGRVASHVPAGRLLVKNDDALTDSSHFGAF